MSEKDRSSYLDLPKVVRVIKTGAETMVIDCETSKEIGRINSIKMDLSNGKHTLAKISFEAIVAEIEVIDPQLNMFMSDEEISKVRN